MECPINEITVPKTRMRKLDKKAVAQMAESMSQHGLINAIVLSGKTLVAGVHRLEAAKLLGWDTIAVTHQGNIQNKATLQLIELDENFVRTDLNPAQKIKHAALRVKLVSELNLPAKIEEVAAAKVKTSKLSTKDAELFGKNCPSKDKDYPLTDSFSAGQKAVIKGAEAKAEAEAIKETAKIMKTSEPNVRANIRDSKYLEDAGLDDEKLGKLSNAKVRHVAKVAKADPEKAKAELEAQVVKPKKGIGSSALSDDRVAYLKKHTKYARDQASRNRSPTLRTHFIDLSPEDETYLDDAALVNDIVAGILTAQSKKTG